MTTCAPDVQSLEVVDATRFKLVVRAAVGPIRGTLNFAVEFTELRTPERAALLARSQMPGSAVEMKSAMELSAVDARRTSMRWSYQDRVERDLRESIRVDKCLSLHDHRSSLETRSRARAKEAPARRVGRRDEGGAQVPTTAVGLRGLARVIAAGGDCIPSLVLAQRRAMVLVVDDVSANRELLEATRRHSAWRGGT